MNSRIKLKGRHGLYESELPFRAGIFGISGISGTEDKRYVITRMLHSVNVGIQHGQYSPCPFEYYKDVSICDDTPYSLEESLEMSIDWWFSMDPVLTAKAFTILADAVETCLVEMPEPGTPVLAIAIGFVLESLLSKQSKIPWSSIENEKLNDEEWKKRCKGDDQFGDTFSHKYRTVFMVEKEEANDV